MMLALLAESALRSLLLGGAVWAGLKLLRVRNPHVQMTAWTMVLVASLAMPALMRLVTVTVVAPPAPLAEIMWPAPDAPAQAVPLAPERTQSPEIAPAAREAHTVSPAHGSVIGAVERQPTDWRMLATAAYVLVAGVLLLRLLIGLALTWRLARAARPLRAGWTGGTDVRVSGVVGVPVTFGSTILLPSDYVAWSPAKRRAVLTHEGAHVAHGDFYVLLLAALNRAVFWFNPFAWWQLVRLAELAEIISDDAALEAVADRPSYAGILIELARRVQRAPAALAMARPGTVRQRVERILAARALPARLGWRRRMLVAGALVPVVALCAATIARGTLPAQPEASATAMAPSSAHDPALDRYAGSYQLGPWAVLTVAPAGDRLSAQVTGQPRFELTRASDTDFVSASPPVRVSFVVDGEQPATATIVRQSKRDRRADRIDAAKARVVGDRFARWLAAAPDRFRDQSPAPGSKAALLRLVDEWQRGAPDSATMSAPLAEAVGPRASQLHAMLTALGPLESVYFRGVGPGGYDIYGAQFASGTAEFRLSLGSDGAIDDVLFRPNGDDTPGEVLACAQEQSLKPGPSAAPIKLTLFNGSGADIQLFELDANGKRTPLGTIGEDRTHQFLTHVGHPWIVADAAGQCLEVLLPGLRTRFHTVQSARAGERPVPARIAPRPGSEEALRQYIDAIGRGRPNYDHMTEEAAADTRQQLLLDQAILAKLGPMRAMSFRGATSLDSDIYMVQFANGSAEWRIRLVKDGKVAGVAIGPHY
jgi:beta-lactamase regulating signal transducer with metallopeptidase domain